MDDQFGARLVCVLCKGELECIESEACRCKSCGHEYRVTFGIIDLRHPDLAQDNPMESQVAEILISNYPNSKFSDLIDIYFLNINLPDVSQHLLTSNKNYKLNQVARGVLFTNMFLSRLDDYFENPNKTLALEIGCGSGTSLIALAKIFTHVVGIEPSLPNLILARKALEEHGITNVQLIQAHGQYIPFPDGSFSHTAAQNVLEHVLEIDSVLAQIIRVLQPGGTFAADSRNRFDLFFPEPHAKVRWVGLLPRSWAKYYVQWRTGNKYEHTQLLSFWELKRALSKSFGKGYKITFPNVAVYDGPEWVDKILAKLEHSKIFLPFFLWFFPSHLVLAQKPR